MAAPGTVTHVLEVARQLAAIADAHAASIDQAAADASADLAPASVPPPPPESH